MSNTSMSLRYRLWAGDVTSHLSVTGTKYLVQSVSKGRLGFGSQFKGFSVSPVGPAWFGAVASECITAGKQREKGGRVHHSSSRTRLQGPSFLLLGPTS